MRYNTGNWVTHKGLLWESRLNNNLSEPGTDNNWFIVPTDYYKGPFNPALSGGYFTDHIVESNGLLYKSLKDGNTSALTVTGDWLLLNNTITNSDEVAEGATHLYYTDGRVATYGNAHYYPLSGNPSGYLTTIASSQVIAALGYTPENNANKGAANGYTPLDASGKVPALYLPSYVDDVIEVVNFASLPNPGETGKIYVTLDTNDIYRWSGSTYIPIVASPGTTDALAEGVNHLYYTDARVAAYGDGRYAFAGGSNASGTWGINITGQAGSIAGQANSATISATETAGVAGSIVQRSASGGYIYSNYFNMTAEIDSGNPSYLVGENSTADGFLRYYTQGSIRSWLGLGDLAYINNGSTVSINITGQAGYANSAGSITNQANSATINASVSAVANTVVLRDSNGYIDVSYINMTADIGSTSPGYLVGQDNAVDSYLRYYSIGQIQSWLGLGSGAYNDKTQLWSTSHPNDFYISNAWDGTYWQVTSNHGSPVSVGHAAVADNSALFNGHNWSEVLWNGYNAGPAHVAGGIGSAYDTSDFGVWSGRDGGPTLGFHYVGVVASSIGIESSGRIAIRNNPGTSYENLIANNLYANSALIATTYVQADRIIAGYDSSVSGSVNASQWFRSSGQTGWYSADYAGGIYMTDTTWVRVYNNKSFLVNNTIYSTSGQIAQSDGGFKSYNYRGMVGNYDSQANTSMIIWTMGDSWNTIGTMYGLGYDYGAIFNDHEITIREAGAVNISFGMAGTGYFRSNVTASGFYQSSLRSLKTDIELTGINALEKIDSLQICDYAYKANPTHKRIGIIADETDEIFLSEDMNSINIQDTLMILIKAVQDISKQNTELRCQLGIV